MKPQRREPQDSAFQRAVSRNVNLLPAGRSVSAFVQWMRSHGFTGEILQDEIHTTYLETCELMGSVPVPLKRFGSALRKAGFPPYQADKLTADGKRWRPMVVNLADKKTSLALVPPVSHQKLTAAIAATPAKPAYLPLSKVA